MQGHIHRILYLTILCLSSNALSAENFTSPFGLTFVKIPAGEFIMGTEDFDQLAEEVDAERLENLKKELPPHKVRISKDFYMATTEVTQSLWKEIMDSEPGASKRWRREDWAQLPVAYVSWNSVQRFIGAVNDEDSRYLYRLPTEAEWEYAARAGTSGLRPFDYVDMDDYAWYRFNSDNKPMPVGRLKPNLFGLYDTIGNVWEWVSDSFAVDYYKVSPEVDPSGPPLSSRKVMRGGSYHCTPERVRVAIRGSNMRNNGSPVLGFRLAAELKD
jgi:formylglycine-generating enzyme required for sulfatase activity